MVVQQDGDLQGRGEASQISDLQGKSLPAAFHHAGMGLLAGSVPASESAYEYVHAG